MCRQTSADETWYTAEAGLYCGWSSAGIVDMQHNWHIDSKATSQAMKVSSSVFQNFHSMSTYRQLQSSKAFVINVEAIFWSCRSSIFSHTWLLAVSSWLPYLSYPAHTCACWHPSFCRRAGWHQVIWAPRQDPHPLPAVSHHPDQTLPAFLCLR